VSLRAALVLTLAAGLGACAATPADQLGTTPPLHQLAPDEGAPDFPLRIWDPIEGTNRGVYKFNARFDEFIFLPLVRGYEFVTPDFIENRVTDFFSNLSEFRNATNGLMQARPDAAGRAVIRLALNSTIGVAGLFDVATPLGVNQEPLDFGLTLGRWGVGDGPYLVVPVLGPSNGRDFSGVVVDSVISSTVPPESIVTDYVYFNPLVYVLYAVDLRRNVNFRYFGSGSPFEYDYVRFLYTKRRELQLRAILGNLPSPEEAEPSPFRSPVDFDGRAPASSAPHQVPTGRLLP
jgi:phospholipid-binding lipoprotein MlaA